jgi:hypothetical protein
MKKNEEAHAAEQVRIQRQLEDIDRELARHALLCRVDLTQESNVRRVLADDASVCVTENPVAFRKMRSLLMLHYVERERAMETLGVLDGHTVADGVVQRLRERFRALGLG